MFSRKAKVGKESRVSTQSPQVEPDPEHMQPHVHVAPSALAGSGDAEPDGPQLLWVHPTHLNLYHRNPRRGKPDEIAKSLRANGQYKPIVVNKGTFTNRPWEVLAGNHTLIAFRDLLQAEPHDVRWQKILVHLVDVDDDRAARIVAADNRTADLGDYDQDALRDLLTGLDGDLFGTGYEDADLAKLLGGDDIGDEGPISGDAETGETPRTFGVVVECETEAQQVALLEQLEAEGFNVRALM